jgi:hypothetical protein
VRVCGKDCTSRMCVRSGFRCMRLCAKCLAEIRELGLGISSV